MSIQPMRLFSPFVLACALFAGSACTSTAPASFDTPQAALQELAATIGAHDPERVEQLLGADGPELLSSGDEVADREDALRVQQYILEKVAFQEHGPDKRIALLGETGWEFPIPLVRESGSWRFDVVAGAEAVANLRVGRNELNAIASLHAYVDAQREYASESRDGQPRAFARLIHSSPGKHDGLYWPVAEGEPDSPLGPLIAEAAREGYTNDSDEPQAFNGYYFRVLMQQGAHAPGGAKSFVDSSGRMTGGFALLAWPAKYHMSGVMTFLVNQQGIVYERDLGPDTATIVAGYRAYDPDDNWNPVAD